MTHEFGKWLIIIGLALAVLGVVFMHNLFPWAGKLPGDIAVKRGDFSFYFPLTTCVLLSLLLTLLMYLFRK